MRVGAPSGQFHYELRSDWPDPGMMPVRGISWYNAARYCNWLHNGKALSLEALVTGAYDTTSWYTDPDGRVHADERHLPGADFWIPTKDEWLKAAHYDPTKDGTGGWWQSPHQSDDPIIYGAPWEGGQSNAFYRGDDLTRYPLALYPDVRSFYGLLDLSGGAAEWNEDFWDGTLNEITRWADGSSVHFNVGDSQIDLVYAGTTRFASDESTIGLRIAARIPTPASCFFVAGGIGLRRYLRRRK